MQAVRVGIVGLGTVGSGTVNVLRRNEDEIARRAGRPVQITHIGARRDNPDANVDGIRISRDIFDVVNDPDVDVLVELIGGTTVALDVVTQAIESGKHVVTANKALIAEKGNEILAAAQAKGVDVAFESSVAGGIPIIAACRDGLTANRIEWLAGIINGTGNFILTEMRDKNREFDDVLAEAQELGYAEADPTFDVEGIDAAHKLAILASVAFGVPLQFEKVYTEGITKIAPVDVNYAEELGYRIKHLGIARNGENGIEMRVHPTLIPESRLIANVNGVMNAVLAYGDAVGPTLYYGAGAGSEPTASAVIADIVQVARQINVADADRSAPLGISVGTLQDKPILGSEDFTSAYYLRLCVTEKAGVLAKITKCISDAGISVEAIIQRPQGDETDVDVVIMTHPVLESNLNKAVAEIASLQEVNDNIQRIRVESLA